jgi:hypothetical protein
MALAVSENLSTNAAEEKQNIAFDLFFPHSSAPDMCNQSLLHLIIIIAAIIVVIIQESNMPRQTRAHANLRQFSLLINTQKSIVTPIGGGKNNSEVECHIWCAYMEFHLVSTIDYKRSAENPHNCHR